MIPLRTQNSELTTHNLNDPAQNSEPRTHNSELTTPISQQNPHHQTSVPWTCGAGLGLMKLQPAWARSTGTGRLSCGPVSVAVHHVRHDPLSSNGEQRWDRVAIAEIS